MNNEQWILDKMVEAARIMAGHNERLDGFDARFRDIEKIRDREAQVERDDDLERARARPSWWMILLVALNTAIAIAALIKH